MVDDNHDSNPLETEEWVEAIKSVLGIEGPDRAKYLLQHLIHTARLSGVDFPLELNTAYCNTITPEQESKLPDSSELQNKISTLLRWNAIAIVMQAGKKAAELGGHLATFASAATLYTIGYNYFFHARTKEHPGDLVYFQGHASPGMYAWAFLEGRFSEKQLEGFRQEVGGNGLPSYPHPWLMPTFWQFPTVSMGLGSLQAIYQAKFLKYLGNRGLFDNKDRKVWAFCGDGELDEPEVTGSLSVAGRKQLDNLIFVVNCNLQRLDGPVRGNGKIIQELERIFRGANWHVIKVIWGSGWDALFARDKSGLLLKRMEECVDGEYQDLAAHDGAYMRENFFGKYPELLELVKDMSDEDIGRLTRGGHDPQKVYAAYKAAVAHRGQPTVILMKTVKGYGMGEAGESLNPTHQQKKMTPEQLKVFCKRFNLEIPENKISQVQFYRPPPSNEAIKFIRERRKALGGPVPARHKEAEKLKIPSLKDFKIFLEGTQDRAISTTMTFVRILNHLLKDKNIKERIVPLVSDEARTFGMEGLFRQIGIYSHVGQLYKPVDRDQVMYYREAKDGQLLEEGITEVGCLASWAAIGTSYSTNGLPMIPMFIFYSMFGFQRTADMIWAASDARTRGFLLGATSGRTTLAGEGLQHDDGQSHVFASVFPSCIAYDPTYAYELAVIMQYGLKRMYVDQEDVFFYITLMNENYIHPAMPKGAEEGIIKGLYLLRSAKKKTKLHVQLMGSGAILREAEAAADLLTEFGVSANVWSVTSFNELRRDIMATDRHNIMHSGKKPMHSYLSKCLEKQKGPFIAATDYVRLFADQIRAHVPGPFYVLGADGYGRSDTRKQLRHHFEVDAKHIAYTALKALVDQGELSLQKLKAAQKKLGIKPNKADPLIS